MEIILEAGDSSIEAWLGANEAKAPKQLLQEYTHAVVEAAKIKVETAAEQFNERPKKERESALECLITARESSVANSIGTRRNRTLVFSLDVAEFYSAQWPF